MDFDFLQPIDTRFIEWINSFSNQNLGAKVVFHTEKNFPELENTAIAILGVSENRGSQTNQKTNLEAFRKEFYKLYAGNWDGNIVDLGDIIRGNSVNDTYFALNRIIAELLKIKIVPIVIGGSQDLTYPLYRSYDWLKKMVNIVSVDRKFDFGDAESLMTTDSYLAKIVIEEPTNLHNHTNIGYQSYFTSQEEIDLINKLFFDVHKLGEIGTDITIAEPVLRDADLVSLDLTSVQSAYTGNFNNFVPNGFTGREICAISRYAGISDRVSCFGIFNSSGLDSEAVLIAQIIWYFIEGFSHRYKEYPISNLKDYTKYTVSFEENVDLVFYKSEISQRWWMQSSNELNIAEGSNNFVLLPCREADYRQALKGIYPEKWRKEQEKIRSVL